MPDDRLAELLLALVAPRDRAAAAVGDLLEDMPRRGRTWFWLSMLRTAAGCVWRDITAAPLRMAAAAAVGWFGYMLLVLLLLVVGYVLTVAAWGAVYLITHHTGVELLADAMRLRFEWAPVPPSVLRLCELTGVIAIAPFYTGQIVAIEWKERAVAFTVMLSLVWAIMLTFAPLVGMFGDRVSLGMLPLIEVFILGGVVTMRRTQMFVRPTVGDSHG
jgi:hypothetical protein